MPILELVSNPSIIAVVQVVDYYKEACRALENSDTASMLGKIQKDWKKLVQMKIYYFAAIAHVRKLRSYSNGWLFKKILFFIFKSFVIVPISTATHGKTGRGATKIWRTGMSIMSSLLILNPVLSRLTFVLFILQLAYLQSSMDKLSEAIKLAKVWRSCCWNSDSPFLYESLLHVWVFSCLCGQIHLSLSFACPFSPLLSCRFEQGQPDLHFVLWSNFFY